MVTQQNTQAKNNLFRKEALEKISSPEQLDLLIKVTNPRRWLSLFALGSLVATAGAWSWFGRIPIITSGRGVIIFPSKVATLQFPSSGQIQDLKIAAGDKVKKGQVIATIDQTELRSQLQLLRDKLTQLQLQDQTAKIVQTQRSGLEEKALEQQRETLRKSLSTVQSLTPVLREQGLEVLNKERDNLRQRLQTLRNLQPALKERWQLRQGLRKEGAVSSDVVLQAEQEFINSQTQINEVESQLNQLDVKATQAQQEYLNNVNRANEIETQLKALTSRNATQKEQDLSVSVNRQKEIQETQRAIAQLEQQLQRNSNVVSEYTGTVLEITAKPGQLLQAGIGIGTIAAQEPNAKLMNVTFLPVSEGKGIKPGMELQVTPSTVKREEFGGIRAKVTNVSPFPVTQQGAASIVGNPDILPSVISQGPHVAVYTELERDQSTQSGYKWSSSKGPDSKVTSGTTTSVRIEVDKKRPIEFVLPILKEWTGLN